ncbi:MULTISPECIES: TetR/AcrR family transcriptional regulator [Staphylococcus]|uniref:TetR/AcrR family transcriptional regulator n=1 Tax=Staphylococcus TaxID=1279 RepID=UPI000BA6100B|nr:MULTISPECIES: TetR/AcrR family transcriptional regulator [Staphylococcus]MCM3295580.1 TetR/AcrR family transcriptional regulator [Staphylococcus capitis]MDS3993561.1 TetR/AcrR family transcriptional regulator [Staphylococcus capitis]PAK57708.1 TetR family transcriptional regulator [Staphylococcus capitis]
MSQDRRVRKTQTAIKDALITLLEKKRFEEITIQEISNLADVNRSTFYTHFIDKYDLLDKMENEKIDEIRSFLESSKNDDELKISESQLRETMDFVINSIGEHLDFYKLMFNLGKESNLHEKLYELLTGHLNHVVNDNDKIRDIPFPYFMSYVSGAGLSLIRHWVEDENRISKEELIQHFYEIVNNGPATLIRREKGI